MLTTLGLDTFVHSAGYGMRHDFRWRRAAQESGTSAVAADLDRLLDVAGSQTITSLCIERSGGRLWLLVCNLPSGRTDFLGRPIGNSLALTGPANADVERAVRGVSAQVLDGRDEFAAGLEAAIAVDDAASGGWRIDRTALDALIAGAAASVVDDLPIDAGARRFHYGDAAAARIAGELLHGPLPRRDGLLVLVSPHHDDDSLRRMDVWRALTQHASVDAVPITGVTVRSEPVPEPMPASAPAAAPPPRPIRGPSPPGREAAVELALASAIVAVFMVMTVRIARRR